MSILHRCTCDASCHATEQDRWRVHEKKTDRLLVACRRKASWSSFDV